MYTYYYLKIKKHVCCHNKKYAGDREKLLYYELDKV